LRRGSSHKNRATGATTRRAAGKSRRVWGATPREIAGIVGPQFQRAYGADAPRIANLMHAAQIGQVKLDAFGAGHMERDGVQEGIRKGVPGA